MKPSKFIKKKLGNFELYKVHKVLIEQNILPEMDKLYISREQHEKELLKTFLDKLKVLLKEADRFEKENQRLKKHLKIINKSYDKEVEDHYKIRKELEDYKKEILDNIEECVFIEMKDIPKKFIGMDLNWLNDEILKIKNRLKRMLKEKGD